MSKAQASVCERERERESLRSRLLASELCFTTCAVYGWEEQSEEVVNHFLSDLLHNTSKQKASYFPIIILPGFIFPFHSGAKQGYLVWPHHHLLSVCLFTLLLPLHVYLTNIFRLFFGVCLCVYFSPKRIPTFFFARPIVQLSVRPLHTVQLS